jgi:hypothetical protein
MSDIMEAGRCLNCGAPLHGSFCGACGQRAVPADPTVRELAGDAWSELTGYDGRVMETLRGLARPGFLTRQYLEGRRAHYLSPVRLYLIVSVLYFLIAASVPEIGGGMRVGITDTDRSGASLSEEDRRGLLAELDTAPWYLRTLLRPVLEDPVAFRLRVFTVMPRVFFALVPVFAVIVSLFYRRHHFPTSLVFALHVHVFAFVVFSVSEASKFTGSEVVGGIAGAITTALFVVYAVRAFRAVFGGSWPMTLVKAAGIAFLYVLASIPAFIVIFVWASLG